MTSSKSNKGHWFPAHWLSLCVLQLWWWPPSLVLQTPHPTGVNKIQAGNLGLLVEHKNDKVTTYETIEDKTNLLKDANGTDMEKEQYSKLQSDVGDNNKSLKDFLKVKVVTCSNLTDSTIETAAALDWSKTTDTLDSFVKGDGKLYPEGTDSKDSSEKLRVIVYWMPTANDNDWNINNGKTTSDQQPLFIDFGIKVLVTQLERESDSFDNTYDKNATYSESIITTIDSSKNTVFVSNVTPSNEVGKTTTVEFPKKIAPLTASSTMKLDISDTRFEWCLYGK